MALFLAIPMWTVFRGALRRSLFAALPLPLRSLSLVTVCPSPARAATAAVVALPRPIDGAAGNENVNEEGQRNRAEGGRDEGEKQLKQADDGDWTGIKQYLQKDTAEAVAFEAAERGMAGVEGIEQNGSKS